MRRCLPLPRLWLCLLGLPPLALSAEVLEINPRPDGVHLSLTEGQMQVDFVTDRIVRVRATPNAAWSERASLMRVERPPTDTPVAITCTADAVELQSAALRVRIDRHTDAVAYSTPEGQPILTENPAQPQHFARTDVIKTIADPATVQRVHTVDGEREVADHYIQTKDREAWQAQLAFRLADHEALYGLGFDETADLNLRGRTKRLYQHNLRIVIPALVSTHGYGLLFDAYSAMTFADTPEQTSLSLEVVDELDYYFIYGPELDATVAGYRHLTGDAVMLPRWAFGYIQSKEHYRTQDEVVATVQAFRERQLPLDGIVQDWNTWKPGQWGGDPDPERYPDIARLIRDVHARDAHLMISIWPNPSDASSAGQALDAAGDRLAGSAYIDFSKPSARQRYWETLAWHHFGQYGMDAWWCDSTEPENADWVWSKTRPADADALNIAGLARILDPQYLQAYGFWGAQGIFEHQRRDAPERRVLNLTRSGYAGGQRFGAMLWTGDTSASWDTLAQQVVAIQSLSATGYPYITTDVGAFFVQKKDPWFWNGQFEQGVRDLGYRELYTRWLQFGAFLPMFRSHGTDTPREPWHFGEPGTPYFDAITRTIDLRYRLLPYFYALAGRVVHQQAPWIRPVAFAFPEDARTHDLKTQFMVGDELLVCPVLSPMHDGSDSTPLDVYLPAGSAWVDFWSGQPYAGGQTLSMRAPLDHSPLLVRAGSILPLGPRQQHVDEKPDSPLEIRIYGGADGSYRLYEDAGDDWGYERGEQSLIPFTWDQAAATLTIGARQGRYPGMPAVRTFHVVRVIPTQGAGLEPAAEVRVVHYKGEAVTVDLGASLPGK